MWVAHILRRKYADKRIGNLEFYDQATVTLVHNSEEELRPMVEIRGIYKNKDWNLSVEGVVVERNGTGEFTVPVYLRGHLSQVHFAAIAPDGQIQRETVFVYAPKAQELAGRSPWGDILVSAGLSSWSYFQTDLGVFTSTTGLLNLQWQTSPERISRWGAFASSLLTMGTLESAPISANPQIMLTRIDGSFRFNQKGRWTHQWLLGGFYLTMFNNNSPFGFTNLLAADVGYWTHYKANRRVTWIGEVHANPIGFPLGQQYLLDLTVSRSLMLKNFHRFELGVGFSVLDYLPDQYTNIRLKMLSLRAGYSF